jgi:tetratricopeptide (TPR) repeat protein
MTEDEAIAALRGSDPAAAAQAEAALWRMWCDADDPELGALFGRGVEAMAAGDLPEAEARFDELIARSPGFAEGWNKRATVRYLREDYAGAIADCREVIARKPHHFGALSGQGLCHVARGEHREAAEMFRRTLAVHPHLVAARRNLAAAMGQAVSGTGH